MTNNVCAQRQIMAGTQDRWDLGGSQSVQRKHEQKECHCALNPEREKQLIPNGNEDK